MLRPATVMASDCAPKRAANRSGALYVSDSSRKRRKSPFSNSLSPGSSRWRFSRMYVSAAASLCSGVLAGLFSTSSTSTYGFRFEPIVACCELRNAYVRLCTRNPVRHSKRPDKCQFFRYVIVGPNVPVQSGKMSPMRCSRTLPFPS